MNFLDLFAGAGGLSEGFLRAGFDSMSHIEMDSAACLTLQTRIAYKSLSKKNNVSMYESYLRNELKREDLYNFDSSIQEELERVINISISKGTLNGIFSRIDHQLKKRKEGVDVIIGGPPCQAYSVMGRSRDPNRMKNDPRNHLYLFYLEFLKKYKPKIFVFENVRGLLSAGSEQQYLKAIENGLKEIGYKAEYKILNAADFGVLQNRERVIIIGWKKNIDFHYPKFSNVEHNANLRTLFEDLPELDPGEKKGYVRYTKNISENHYLYKNKIRNGLKFVSQHQTRPHNEIDLEIYRLAINLWLNEKRRIRYDELPERLIKHKNRTDFLDRFKVLDREGVSHTVVAHLSKDGHYYIYPSPENPRSISIREAARIQSFPDDFFFEGGQGAAFRQIGNAVPPLMAEKIAMEIKKGL